MNASAPARLRSANALAFCDSVSRVSDGYLPRDRIPVLGSRRNPESRDTGLFRRAGGARARTDLLDLVEVACVSRGWSTLEAAPDGTGTRLPSGTGAPSPTRDRALAERPAESESRSRVQRQVCTRLRLRPLPRRPDRIFRIRAATASPRVMPFAFPGPPGITTSESAYAASSASR